jgi:branched-chain amino acid transport system ATP-binding protein
MTTALISASDLTAGYRGVVAISGVDIEVRPGELVLLAGANGAGKTTTVKTLSGALPAMSGSVTLFGQPTDAPLHLRVRAGLGVVTEARTICMSLTVRDNLRLCPGANLDRALATFPELEAKMGTKAGLLSGGEQQMLALGRALMQRPRVLLADELSQGLSPIVVKRLIAALRQATDDGAGVLLVEQHVKMAMSVVDRAYLMRSGRLLGEFHGHELRNDSTIVHEMYL